MIPENPLLNSSASQNWSLILGGRRRKSFTRGSCRKCKSLWSCRVLSGVGHGLDLDVSAWKKLPSRGERVTTVWASCVSRCIKSGLTRLGDQMTDEC